MIDVRNKGHSFERAIVNKLKLIGIDARRGRQEGGAHEPDVVMPDRPDWWLELTCGKDPSPKIKMQQAIRDCGDKTPAIVWRKDRCPVQVSMRLKDVVPVDVGRLGGILVTFAWADWLSVSFGYSPVETSTGP